MLLSFLFLLSAVQGVVVAIGIFSVTVSRQFFAGVFCWHFSWPVCFVLFLWWWALEPILWSLLFSVLAFVA